MALATLLALIATGHLGDQGPAAAEAHAPGLSWRAAGPGAWLGSASREQGSQGSVRVQAAPTETPGFTTIRIDLEPAGIDGDVTGSISLQVPAGYELRGAEAGEHSWGEASVRWTDYDFHGTHVLDTMVSPDGEEQSSLGTQADGLYIAGGVLFLRGPVDIRTAAEQGQRPYVEGSIYDEGAIDVPGDATVYPSYYYLSTSTVEHASVTSQEGEEIPVEWTSVHHHFYIRIALSQSEPLYTVALWGSTWGLPDRTDERGWEHTYTIDGQPQLDRHREVVRDILASIRISNWSAPSAAPTEVTGEQAPSSIPSGVTGSEWLDAVPLPTEISTEPEVVGTNLVLALFFALAFGLTSALFNATLEENEELIHARLAPLLRPLRRALERLPRPSAGSRFRGVGPTLLLLLTALLYALLDPGFGISASGAIMFLSFFVALAVVVCCYDGIQALLGVRFYGLKAQFRLFPVALAFGVVCVLLTRWMDFHPGYLYGFVAGFALLGMEKAQPRSWAFLVLSGAGALLAVSLACWALAVPVDRLAEGGVWGSSALYGVLVAIFVAGLEGLLFTLVPLTFMDGVRVMTWSRIVWGVAFGLSAWLFFHVLINPDSAYLEALAGKKVVVMLGTLAVYSTVTLGTWLFFRWVARRRAPADPST